MFLVNEEGDFCSLTYDYEPYSFDKLYFRKGIVVTAESNNKKPYMMNFLLFQKPVSEEKQREYFPGMLKLTDNYFFVPKNEVESLLEDKQFAKLMKKYCGYLEDKGGAFLHDSSGGISTNCIRILLGNATFLRK